LRPKDFLTTGTVEQLEESEEPTDLDNVIPFDAFTDGSR
jgi:hypothetical protein